MGRTLLEVSDRKHGIISGKLRQLLKLMPEYWKPFVCLSIQCTKIRQLQLKEK